MTEADDSPARPSALGQRGLASRLVGVLLTPHRTFGVVVLYGRRTGPVVSIYTLCSLIAVNAAIVLTQIGG